MQRTVDDLDVTAPQRRIAHYRGAARVSLDILEYDGKRLQPSDSHYASIFQEIQEKRSYSEHRIPAIVDSCTFEAAIGLSGTSRESLLATPQLHLPFLHLPGETYLECLRIPSDVLAAIQALPGDDAWWGVDLFVADTDETLRRALCVQFTKSPGISDGEIYLKVRHYQDRYAQTRDLEDRASEVYWWAQLSYNKQENLQRLFATSKSDYFRAFDALRVIPGLWPGFQISALKTILYLGAKKEILNYVGTILHTWATILDGRRDWMRDTDYNTVQLLQSRVPARCADDCRVLEECDHQLFSGIRDQQNRNRIWENLRRIDNLIPSWYTFFEDANYFAICARVMKRLLVNSGGRISSIRHRLRTIYDGSNQEEGLVRLQVDEGSFYTYRGDRNTQIRLGTVQLWLFVWRHWTSLAVQCPRKEGRQPTPVPTPPNEYMWSQLASLAFELGFNAPEIERLRNLAVEPPPAREDTSAAPDLSLYLSGAGEGIRRRCGRPFADAQNFVRPAFFLGIMLPTTAEGGRGISPLFVRVSMFQAFFSSLLHNGLDGLVRINSHLQHFPRVVDGLNQSPDQGRMYRLQRENDDLREEILRLQTVEQTFYDSVEQLQQAEQRVIDVTAANDEVRARNHSLVEQVGNLSGVTGQSLLEGRIAALDQDPIFGRGNESALTRCSACEVKDTELRNLRATVSRHTEQDRCILELQAELSRSQQCEADLRVDLSSLQRENLETQNQARMWEEQNAIRLSSLQRLAAEQGRAQDQVTALRAQKRHLEIKISRLECGETTHKRRRLLRSSSSLHLRGGQDRLAQANLEGRRLGTIEDPERESERANMSEMSSLFHQQDPTPGPATGPLPTQSVLVPNSRRDLGELSFSSRVVADQMYGSRAIESQVDGKHTTSTNTELQPNPVGHADNDRFELQRMLTRRHPSRPSSCSTNSHDDWLQNQNAEVTHGTSATSPLKRWGVIWPEGHLPIIIRSITTVRGHPRVVDQTLQLDRSDLEKICEKYIQKGFLLFSETGKALHPCRIWDAVKTCGLMAILLIPRSEIVTRERERERSMLVWDSGLFTAMNESPICAVSAHHGQYTDD
ncbi:uncharacterized protein TRUGW13939_08805 [Talaromyces rugulosus]|uniref:Uncharacterized protein n=1 Tax=Talaromyces rugulosus TaxID=121627 RepID=A0A7H8RAM9_TALRU|nr:uncharacterized protein TRUGW13939_08805 [Talaromyces rugulosus]QKX61653.1 hypothetical protein TRUGW13939_08805 [Talaromyces rugulosus]